MCCLADLCRHLPLGKVLYSSLLLHECVILVARSPGPVIVGAEKITDDFTCLSCHLMKTSSSERVDPQVLSVFLAKLSM